MSPRLRIPRWKAGPFTIWWGSASRHTRTIHCREACVCGNTVIRKATWFFATLTILLATEAQSNSFEGLLCSEMGKRLEMQGEGNVLGCHGPFIYTVIGKEVATILGATDFGSCVPNIMDTCCSCCQGRVITAHFIDSISEPTEIDSCFITVICGLGNLVCLTPKTRRFSPPLLAASPGGRSGKADTTESHGSLGFNGLLGRGSKGRESCQPQESVLTSCK